MVDSGTTPLRAAGSRTSEGWILLRDVGSTYDDGVEERLHQVLQDTDDLRSVNSDLLIRSTGRAEAFQLDPARANIVRGLDISPDSRVLEIGAGLGAITRYLGERAALVDAIEPAPARARVARARTRDLPHVEIFVGDNTDIPAVPTYDVIVVVGVLEYVGNGTDDIAPYVAFLSSLERALVPGGTIALAIENKLGVKYLVGAPEDHTDRVFDSIESYPAPSIARTFSRRELEHLFVEAGLVPSVRIAFPDYKLTRALMDADALAQDAPTLLRNLPSFPSPDLRSPRPPLADEAHVWGSLVDAGLAAETGNSFLVLAGKGAEQTLWPSDLLALYYSRSRRENYAFERRVVRSDDEVLIDRRRVGRADPDARIAFTEGVERYVPGPTIQEAAAGRDMAEIEDLLRLWVDRLREHASAVPEGTPFDYVPNNLILLPDGSIAPIDQEWTAPGWPLDRVVRRGVLWFAAQLVRSTSPARWDGYASVRQVATSLGAAAGLDDDGSWLVLAVAEEGELLAEISVPQGDEGRAAAAARVAQELTALLDQPLTELPLGERLPETFLRVQAYLAESERSVAHLAGELESAVSQVARADKARRQAEAATTQAHQEVADVRAALDTERARAESVEDALRGVMGGRAFRLINVHYRTVEKIAPRGTRRREVYTRSVTTTGQLARRLRPLPRQVAEVPARMSIPTSEQPRVTIVIPVHGKWDYTSRCLEAVARTSGGIPFEVVVVDDASPDNTADRLRKVDGIRVVTMNPNAGFVGACNAGIAAARGELVVLLNNDTRVDPGWLSPLVETISEPDVGLVGSRLVYPDGSLQEAGGIIFSDGSGWNYGKFGSAEDPAFTYRRDVDYCSGASIIFRRSTIEALGGLDTRFSPAYYDDTDLAFAVRSLGLRVVYQPRSIVVHDEGVSHGTDESSGIKAYQAVNKEKFVAKWRDALDEQCPPGAESVPFAARRRNGERIVVVIDHYVPRPDEDSGSVRMMGILRTLRELGYGVLFVPDNRARTEHWTDVLGQMGVEVFYGHGDLHGHLASLAENIEAVMVSRVTVAWNHVLALRTVLPDVPVIFDTVDLHFLREERAAELAGEASTTPRAQTLRALELAIAESSDTTLVVSSYEQELLRRILPAAEIKVLPNIHHREAFASSVHGRDGLLFVGSFAHQPNADGLQWFFSEVLPLVEQTFPGVRVDVVGRDPDPALVAGAPANVTFHGWVEDLTPLYDGARIAIAPLRYGAGVKGKIGEAMAHGVPVVMTPIGAEGMDIRHNESAWVAHDAESFANGVVTLLEDEETWQVFSKTGAEHIDAIFGPAAFRQLLVDALDVPRRSVDAGAPED